MKIWMSAGSLGWSGCICDLKESSEVAEFPVNKSDFSRLINKRFKIKIVGSYSWKIAWVWAVKTRVIICIVISFISKHLIRGGTGDLPIEGSAPRIWIKLGIPQCKWMDGNRYNSWEIMVSQVHLAHLKFSSQFWTFHNLIFIHTARIIATVNLWHWVKSSLEHKQQISPVCYGLKHLLPRINIYSLVLPAVR